MTRENPLRRFRLSALLALTVILYGTAGYMLIEGWDAFDAFYMPYLQVKRERAQGLLAEYFDTVDGVIVPRVALGRCLRHKQTGL